MKVKAILACDMNYGIGKNGDLPWPRSSRDMAWFRNNTIDGVVLMGRQTWLSIGSKPLPNRVNVVVSGRQLEGPEYTTSGDMKMILDRLVNRYPEQDIWVIGGADVYEQALPYCDQLYLTRISRDYDCDRFVDSDITKEFPQNIFRMQDKELSFQIWEK